MHPTRRHLLTAASAAVLVALLPGCAQTPEKKFEPVVGQAGKDVIWVPTPDEVVQRMLDMAEVKPGERVVDLGSGDGKIAIAAARRGARARGIEYNPDMVALSRRNAREAGVQVDFRQGDIFKEDFREADVVTLYLLPTLNERLRPILLDMKPGTRVTSHQFRMGDWMPDRTDELASREAHLWIVPAKVAGKWNLRVADAQPVPLELSQRYQNVEGHAQVEGNRVPLEQAKLRGSAIRFDLPAGNIGALRFEGTVDPAGRMQGTVTSPAGQRRPFTATRS
ncbi:methyltransferase domain-containing protein [Ramlibacter sp. AW1]|uniref:Methyltransferase domain-containing protein n=1 Tax=Ramlibacter aurantiacus TaxID=2801330 RepID=A0A937D694_9BURK|nr:class I SAM-dependent methyltransferase [Ramlibacter aurantiacus]MBL0420728.1 methyltransferase domain-containing protein [Ramlibacter aurantiacus]